MKYRKLIYFIANLISWNVGLDFAFERIEFWNTVPQYSSSATNRIFHEISGKSWNDGLIMSS